MADDSDSDEWGMEELVIPSDDINSKNKKITASDDEKQEDEEDDYWAVEKPEQDTAPRKEQEETHAEKQLPPGEPIIIVDITQIDSNIHSRFDRNSVNDSAAASSQRKKIESNYEQYARDSSLISVGTVIPCGSSVWRDAIIRLRDERPGHYFVPIFPPKKK
uniref:Uncharacterized protein n=1 Tax=Ditylum brightwellii TaxID=49249 RepID=A0A7S1ZJ12_9STRA